MARSPRPVERGVFAAVCVCLSLITGCTTVVRLPDVSIGLTLFGVALSAPQAELHIGDTGGQGSGTETNGG